MARVGRGEHLHIERFGPVSRSGSAAAAAFEVELATRRVVDVASEQTVLDAVRAAGVNAPSSCEMGICGTCETKVLSGLVDHRDEPLTDEKAAGKHDDDLCLPRGVPPDQYLE